VRVGYMYPNDEKEMDRLDIMHKMTEVTLGRKLHLAPIMRRPRRILDLGTGTGIWAVEMGMTIPHVDGDLTLDILCADHGFVLDR